MFASLSAPQTGGLPDVREKRRNPVLSIDSTDEMTVAGLGQSSADCPQPSSSQNSQ